MKEGEENKGCSKRGEGRKGEQRRKGGREGRKEEGHQGKRERERERETRRGGRNGFARLMTLGRPRGQEEDLINEKKKV